MSGDPGRLPAAMAALEALRDFRLKMAELVGFDRLAMGVLDAHRDKLLLHEEADDGAGVKLVAALSTTAASLADAMAGPGAVVAPAGETPAPEGGGESSSMLVIPVPVYGRAAAAVRLLRLNSPPFTLDDGARAGKLVAQHAHVLRELVLYLRTELAEIAARRNYEQLVAFSRVGNLIVQEKDLDRICNFFMEALKENSVFRRGILTLLDDDLKGCKWFFFGMGDEEIEYFHSHATSKMTRQQRARIFQEKFRLGNSYFLPESAGFSDWGVRHREDDGTMVDWGPNDFLFIPLYGSHKRLVGIVSVDDPDDGRVPTAEMLSSLELFANQVAHSIEEKKLDQEVKKSTRKYRTLVETMNDGLVVMDLSERITLVNPTLCKLVGYRLEEMVGSTLYTFLHEASRGLVEAKGDERRLGIKSRYEMELLSKEGTRIPVLLSGAPLYEANKLVGSFAVVSDLREQRKAQLEFHKMHREIVATNEKLTCSMESLKTTQEQLVQAEKLSAIGELVSGVAHELNNPLTGVLGYSQLLLGRKVDDYVRARLKTIYSEAERCRKIVQNLLTFARKHTPAKTPVNVNEIIQATLELRAYQLRVDNIEVENRLDENLPQTMADAHQLQQVLLNLINNAHQAMVESKGRGRLVLSSGVENDTIIVTCTDNGPGIASEHLGRIFDPFFTTKEVGKGTGLGLSLSYGVMREHGGTISVRNIPEGGTEFRLELPVRLPQAAGQATGRRSPGRLAPAGKRILVVDDEQTVLDLLAD
ncbi:MAG: ATP-binding protein, partial [Acidobacteria bacterium]|nr:ATP-binding protein [Acidobacteriota bacterium]